MVETGFSAATADLLRRIGCAAPIFQAPMAGTSSPALAAAVGEAGGLGALGVGAMTAAGALKAIAETRALTDKPLHVNFFCHEPTPPDPARDAAWLKRLAPLFAPYGAEPPARLAEIYQSFKTDDSLLAAALEARPAVVSFHFGLPSAEKIAALKQAGILLLASATQIAEGEAVAAAGLDGVIAQGWEAGGHRGIFEPAGPDSRLSALDLTRELARRLPIPIIAAGGIMNGAEIAQALKAGAAAAQLGTAYVGCPESLADAGYRTALREAASRATTITPAISGRPARCLGNLFTAFAEGVAPQEVAAYPYAYDAGKALNAAAKAKGEAGYGAQWAGTGAARSREMGAGDLTRLLRRELQAALSA